MVRQPKLTQNQSPSIVGVFELGEFVWEKIRLKIFGTRMSFF